MLKRNDLVMVTTGKDRGKTGKLLRLLSEEGRAVVEKLNLVKRHQKPNVKMRQGGILEKEASIDLSNLLFYCPKCSKGVRLGTKVRPDGKKVRVCKKCREEIV